MSANKRSIPQLQRSRSSSAIPLARNSRLPVRNSTQKNRGKSLSRPGLEKRSLDRNLIRSNSQELPRYSRQRSGSLVRQTLTVTPLSRGSTRPGSGRKSPLLSSVRKDNRPITDKKWQNEQLTRVRNFVSIEFPHIDHGSIKSGLPLDVFINLMHSYFQLIDARIIINRENYIDAVPTNLKRIRYPTTTVKPSLMKTVNTPHSWSQVLAIFSWLTDIVCELNATEDVEEDRASISNNCTWQLFYNWNMGQDDSIISEEPIKELDAKLVDVLDIHEDEINNVDEDFEKLKQNYTIYCQKKEEGMKKIEALQKLTDDINSKCNSFKKEKEDYEKNVSNKQEVFVNKIKKIDQELVELAKTEEHLKTVVAAQPHSCAEHQQLTKEIESLQNTTKLKEERYQQQQELVSSYDFQMSDLKQKIEAKAYKCNNIVGELELINPKFKKLRIRESGFARLDTEDELKKVNGILTSAIAKSNEYLKTSQRKFEEAAEQNKRIDEQLKKEEKELEDVIKLDAELGITLAQKQDRRAKEEKKAFAEVKKRRAELLELKNSRIKLEPFQQKEQEVEKQLYDLLKFKEELKEKALEFFINLRGQISNNLENYMEIMCNTTDVMQSTQEQLLKDSSERIEHLTKVKEEVEKKVKKGG